MIKVMLLFDLSSGFDRKLLRGMVRYSKEHEGFLFYRVPAHLRDRFRGGDNVVSIARSWGADAIVGRWIWDTSLLDSLGIPAVLQGYYSRSVTHSNITGNYLDTGRIAAQFFLKRRFMNFAYFGIKNVIWSNERRQGFVEALMQAGFECNCFLADGSPEVPGKELTRWLKALPKPVALFAGDDACALHISETCKIENIHIPGDISLLGVDDDELLCEISDPPISSIPLDVEQGGYVLMEKLHRKLLRGEKEHFSVVIEPGEVTRRSSTDMYRISDPHVKTVVGFIEEKFQLDINMKDICMQVPLSSRALEIRFKKELGTTIYRFLTECRVEHMAYLLLSTDLPAQETAVLSGFRDPMNVSRIFRKLKGCTPMEYRKRSFCE